MMTHRIQLEKVVLELQQRYQKALFQLHSTKNAKEYFKKEYAVNQALTDEARDIYFLVKDWYDEANKI